MCSFLPLTQHRLTLIISLNTARLSEYGRQLAEDLKCQTLDVGADLSAAMINLPVKERPRFVPEWLGQKFNRSNDDWLVFYNIDILFEPSLQLDPLKLFQKGSLITRLVILWPGAYSEHRTLSYAVPEHSHYRYWHNPVAGILNLEEISQ